MECKTRFIITGGVLKAPSCGLVWFSVPAYTIRLVFCLVFIINSLMVWLFGFSCLCLCNDLPWQRRRGLRCWWATVGRSRTVWPGSDSPLAWIHPQRPLWLHWAGGSARAWASPPPTSRTGCPKEPDHWHGHQAWPAVWATQRTLWEKCRPSLGRCRYLEEKTWAEKFWTSHWRAGDDKLILCRLQSHLTISAGNIFFS